MCEVKLPLKLIASKKLIFLYQTKVIKLLSSVVRMKKIFSAIDSNGE